MRQNPVQTHRVRMSTSQRLISHRLCVQGTGDLMAALILGWADVSRFIYVRVHLLDSCTPLNLGVLVSRLHCIERVWKNYVRYIIPSLEQGPGFIVSIG
jgi:hypothetical protein